MTQFLVRSAYESAKKQLAEEHLVQLDRANSAAFVAALDTPSEPNDALLAFVKEQRNAGTADKES